MRVKRWLAMLLVFLLLPGLIPAGAEETLFTPLAVGAKGEEVLRVKNRLYELGYFQSNQFTKKYTEDTARVVRSFQQVNGLPETGEVDGQTLHVTASQPTTGTITCTSWV